MNKKEETANEVSDREGLVPTTAKSSGKRKRIGEKGTARIYTSADIATSYKTSHTAERKQQHKTQTKSRNEFLLSIAKSVVIGAEEGQSSTSLSWEEEKQREGFVPVPETEKATISNITDLPDFIQAQIESLAQHEAQSQQLSLSPNGESASETATDEFLPSLPPTDVPEASGVRIAELLAQQQQQKNKTTDASSSNPEVETSASSINFEGLIVRDQSHKLYLRSGKNQFLPTDQDPQLLLPTGLHHSYFRNGDWVCGSGVLQRQRYPTLLQIEHIAQLNHRPFVAEAEREVFEKLTPIFPQTQFVLEKGNKTSMACRLIDLFAPIGKGQRALIVAPPKTGKTMLLKEIANAIAAREPETQLMMLLIDERPEEVTDMQRSVKAEVYASTFDESPERHVALAQIVLDKAKRCVEAGEDVVIFLDSITRLARAFNTIAPTSGRVLTGGVDANALQAPKRFFGAARNVENGASLTIIATALVETGSKMDEVIFEEFKGTGNMELILERGLANKRIFPAINLVQSSTRREELMLTPEIVACMSKTRRYMADMTANEAMDFLQRKLRKSKNNAELVARLNEKIAT